MNGMLALLSARGHFEGKLWYGCPKQPIAVIAAYLEVTLLVVSILILCQTGIFKECPLVAKIVLLSSAGCALVIDARGALKNCWPRRWEEAEIKAHGVTFEADRVYFIKKSSSVFGSVKPGVPVITEEEMLAKKLKNNEFVLFFEKNKECRLANVSICCNLEGEQQVYSLLEGLHLIKGSKLWHGIT